MYLTTLWTLGVRWLVDEVSWAQHLLQEMICDH